MEKRNYDSSGSLHRRICRQPSTVNRQQIPFNRLRFCLKFLRNFA